MCSKKWAKPVRPGSTSSRAPVRTIDDVGDLARGSGVDQVGPQAVVEFDAARFEGEDVSRLLRAHRGRQATCGQPREERGPGPQLHDPPLGRHGEMSGPGVGRNTAHPEPLGPCFEASYSAGLLASSRRGPSLDRPRTAGATPVAEAGGTPAPWCPPPRCSRRRCNHRRSSRCRTPGRVRAPAPPRVLRGEERLEDPGDDLLGHPDAVVADLEDGELPLTGAGMRRGEVA